MANIEKRTTKDGKTRYRALVRMKGHPAQSATFERLTDARRWVQDTESAIREGRHFKTTEAKRHTLGEAIDRYLVEIMPRKPRSSDDQTQQLRWWKQEIGCRVLADLDGIVISECRNRLATEILSTGKKRSHGTVNRYLAALSHLLTIAVKEWGWLQDHPMASVVKLKEPAGRVRFLSDDERTRLLAACQASSSIYLYPLVVLALSTGMRRDEARCLRWKDIDIERGVILVSKTKNDQPKGVPLTGLALRLITSIHAQRVNSEFAFPNPDGSRPIDIRTAWEKARERAGVEDFHFHDLRHSTASYLAMNGASAPPSRCRAFWRYRDLREERHAQSRPISTCPESSGGDARVLHALVSWMCRVPKCRAADNAILAGKDHPQFEADRERIGGLDTGQLVDVVADTSHPTTSRVMAAWRLAGTHQYPSDHWPQQRGDLEALFVAYERAGVPMCVQAACRAAVGLMRYALPISLPVLWSAAQGQPSTVQDCNVSPLTFVNGVPTYALGKHTRLGKQALRMLTERCDGLRRHLEQHSGCASWTGAVGAAHFHVESAEVSRKLVWGEASDLEGLGAAGDLNTFGIPVEATPAFLACFRDHLSDLDAIRVRLLERITADRPRQLV